MQLRNHKVGYFDPLLWAVRVMICVETFCKGGKCSVVLCLKNHKYGGVSSLKSMLIFHMSVLPVGGAFFKKIELKHVVELRG